MTTQSSETQSTRVHVQNIDGIDVSTVSLEPLQRRNGDVVTDNTPYSDAPEPVSLFAFLLQSNEARQAVTPGTDLRDLIMRPKSNSRSATRSRLATTWFMRISPKSATVSIALKRRQSICSTYKWPPYLNDSNTDTLERVWLELSPFDVDTSTFTLKILRWTGDVMTHPDRIDHLSEFEREVIGVIFALNGYIVHDVCETAPFILLDSIEAIDSERIASLVEYLAEYTRYFVVALQNDDVDAIDTDYHCVTDI